MQQRFHAAITWLRDMVRQNSEVQGEATLDSLKRFRLVAIVCVVVNIGYTLEFWFHPKDGETPVRLLWANGIGWVHVCMGISSTILGVLMHRYCKSHQRSSAYALALHIVFCANCLLFAIALSVVDQWVTTSTTNFATLSMMTAMMSLMRPRFTLALFGLAYVAFYNLLPLTQPDADLLAIARSQSLGALVMSVVVSIIVWRQYVVSVLLRREIVVANQALTAKQVELAVMATRDSLTGLFVRREFMRLAEMELARAARFSNDTGVLMVDLDFFKRINDQYGHPAGDEVLQQVANLLSAGVRATDVVGRLGGEEFIVLMPNTSVEGALSVAEKLRTSLRSEPLKIAGLLIPVTASIGVSAQVHQLAVSVEGLYAAADRALYVAKKSGRDRVEYAAPVEPAAA